MATVPAVLNRFLAIRRHEKQLLRRLLAGTQEEQRKALDALGAIRWNRRLRSPKPRDPAVWRAACREAKERGEPATRIVTDALVWAFVEASKDAHTRQLVRLGPTWIKDQRGRRKRVRPCDLPQGACLQWVRSRAYRNLSHWIGRDQVSLRHQLTPEPVTDVTAEQMLLAATEPDELLDLVVEVWSLPELSRRERQVLRLKRNGFSNRQIARKLRLNPTSIRVHFHRARKKIVRLFPEVKA